MRLGISIEIAARGKNVYVKIPVTNTRRESSAKLVCHLASEGVQLNVTALMTLDQVREVSMALEDKAPSYISVFAGRPSTSSGQALPIPDATRCH